MCFFSDNKMPANQIMSASVQYVKLTIPFQPMGIFFRVTIINKRGEKIISINERKRFFFVKFTLSSVCLFQ
jgi:hypothetical protein